MAHSQVKLCLNYVLSITLLIQIALGASNSIAPLFHFCFTSDNFTTDSPYQTNLNKLLTNLLLDTPPTGFSSSFAGQSNDTTFGLSNCRGTINTANCSACINDATSLIRQGCPNNKGGMIWYDDCFMKYSNSNFFGTIDNEDVFIFPVEKNVTKNPEAFYQNVTSLLFQLSAEASLAPKLFATGELEIEPSEKVFGLVECTRDLSSFNCKACIDATIGILPNNTLGTGRKIIGGSCNVRYEMFQFFND
ncbi:hypothetical protein ACH5RR_029047 [Cinchona calisaya]|uniref:Gnk2-homologous domain-containing protein n=1 Tax=Cinchona calisaya TaxID=153742 RepID=A0ABD2YQI9_9GENT